MKLHTPEFTCGVAIVAALAACGAGPSATEQPADPPPAMLFDVHEIDRPGGKNFGQTSAVDIDKDGDLDFVSAQRQGSIFWFEFQGPKQWVRHLIGGPARTDVGGVAFDVDGDGWVDQASGSGWFRNTGDPSKPFERFNNGAIESHDNLAADIDGDGKLDLLALLDKKGVFWYSIPADATQPWVEHAVYGVTDPPCHGGLAAGDIDGDGDVDIARLDRWFENADGRGGEWTEHQDFEFGKVGPWGLQTRAKLADIDSDGDVDLVQAEGDVLDGRVAWFENLDGQGGEWSQRTIRTPGHSQDFHSICVADFDNDSDLDVFSGGGPLTEGGKLWFIWENLDGEGGAWTEHTIAQGLSTHESVCADVDADGDIDILTKPWRGDLHVFAENLLVRKQD